MIVAVSGTGTGVGKTHVACALIGALRDHDAHVVGWKPVESGVTGPEGDDERRLREASGASASPTVRLTAPLAPNVAARREGVSIDPAALRATLRELAARWSIVVVELAGGLCSPFDDALDNAEWLAQTGRLGLPLNTIVVAPDRLGVIHDVISTVRAAAVVGVTIDTVLLSAPETSDASTSTNLEELFTRKATSGIHLLEVPHAPIDELRVSPPIVALAYRLVGSRER
jgi:dethiobiotin synthetase